MVLTRIPYSHQQKENEMLVVNQRETDELKKQLSSFVEVINDLSVALNRVEVLEAELVTAKSELEESNKRYEDVLSAAEETETIMQKVNTLNRKFFNH